VRDGDEVIQIGIIDTAGRELLSSLVRPTQRKSVPAKATEVHGITFASLRTAPTWPELSPAIEAALNGRVPLAYNAAFDARLIRQTAEKNGGLTAPSTWQCIMLAYASFVGEPDPHGRGYKWQKLPAGDHSALGDCRAALEVIRLIAADEAKTPPT
jgi:DNA polymerase-3 subunit epsilon